jgi:hypothetical protein
MSLMYTGFSDMYNVLEQCAYCKSLTVTRKKAERTRGYIMFHIPQRHQVPSWSVFQPCNSAIFSVVRQVTGSWKQQEHGMLHRDCNIQMTQRWDVTSTSSSACGWSLKKEEEAITAFRRLKPASVPLRTMLAFFAALLSL